MIKYIFILSYILFISGCGTEDNAHNRFDSMCDRQDLYICGDDVEIQSYSNGDIQDLVIYTKDKLNYQEYKYVLDSKLYGVDDYYAYMTYDDGMLYGDCEDYSITFAEDNIVNGNIDKGELSIMFGKNNGIYHSWVIIEKDGKQYLFDTNFRYGKMLGYVYDNYDYSYMFTLYKY
mgnify:CR=1 FL=1